MHTPKSHGFATAVTAFLALPGVVAFAVPIAWLWGTGRHEVVQPFGWLPWALGIIGLLWCVRDFHVAGQGTLAPWSPPTRLVVIGLYRFSRNPMYVCVTLILLGWTITFGSRGLLLYTLCVATAFHLRVVFGEEPWLARRHGGDWDDYVRRVRRWF